MAYLNGDSVSGELRIAQPDMNVQELREIVRNAAEKLNNEGESGAFIVALAALDFRIRKLEGEVGE